MFAVETPFDGMTHNRHDGKVLREGLCIPVAGEQQCHLFGRDYWKDVGMDLIFIKHDTVVNSVNLARIVPELDAIHRDLHQNRIIDLMIHEQYSQPQFVAFKADAKVQAETAVRWVTGHGYKWAIYADGFVGAESIVWAR
jgi:hypothetical protein